MENQAVILFSVKGVGFVVSASDIVSILETQDFKFVLGAPDYVPGLTLFMGEALLTIDVAKKLSLGLDSEGSEEGGQLLIVKKVIEGKVEKFSLLVNSVSDVRFVEQGNIVDVSSEKDNVLNDLIKAKVVSEAVEIDAVQYGFFMIENIL